MQKNISREILCARFLTILHDCKICSKLDPEDIESGQDECKAGVLNGIDALLMDAEELMDDTIKKDDKKPYEVFILIIIQFKKICFNCDCKSSMMLDLYKQSDGNLETHEGIDAENKASIKKDIPNLHSIKKIQ